MNDLERLERGYRRLLAWYPRAFRRENSEEILAVLLACAQEGQRRPGLAASADLIKAAIWMRLRPPSSPPGAVRAAIRLMCLAAAAELGTLITIIVTAGSVRSAVVHRYPGLRDQLVHVVNAHLVADEVGIPIVMALWLLLAWMNSRGRDAARVSFAAFFLLNTLGLLISLGQGDAVYAPADMIAATVVWVLALAASVLLFTRPANRYYRPAAAAAVTDGKWHGTFGTM